MNVHTNDVIISQSNSIANNKRWMCGFYIDLAYYRLCTASSIRMGSPYQSDCMRRARDVCEGICNRMIQHISYYCKYGVLVFGDDGTGPADESKRTKHV